ncbi:MAG: DNA methylase [Nitrospirota bacterium]
MAESLAHTFGQIVGNVLEEAIEPHLRKFALEHGLYLDKKGPRKARDGKKVTWTDLYGNAHDLDFVLERGGTDGSRGAPVAFIETAWRRYTKHSRNKAQEIQGAIQVLALTHKYSCPFTGAILAGVFTEGALTQLKSLGFQVLFFPYRSIVEAFQTVGVDANFDEDTREREFRKKISRWKNLSKKAKRGVAEHLVTKHERDIANFLGVLEKTVTRRIDKVIVIPLHGRETECSSITEAIEFLASYESASVQGPVFKYEVHIRYNNGDKVMAEFTEKTAAMDFLKKY